MQVPSSLPQVCDRNDPTFGAIPLHDDPAIAAWHERMATEQAKRKYRARPGLCELPNAHLKCHHGLHQVLVRGIEHVSCLAFLAVLTANLLAHASSLLS